MTWSTASPSRPSDPRLGIMTLDIMALSPELAFGRRVDGLTPHDLTDEGVRQGLRNAWINHGLVIFQGSQVTPELLVDLSRVFAELDMHPVHEIHTPGHPELITIVSDPRKETATLIEVDGEQCGAWLPWHKDLVFTDRVNRGGLLHAKQVTSRGGCTGFVDQIGAYATLPEALKARIEGLEVVYRIGNIETSPFGTRQNVRYLRESDTNKSVMARSVRDFPPVVHPLVFVQQETERKVLNLSPRFAQFIVGIDQEESDALLGTLSTHIWDSPAYFHQWRTDEMVLWDNWRMLHCVTPAPPDEVRIVQRTTLRGDYGLGRKLSAAA